MRVVYLLAIIMFVSNSFAEECNVNSQYERKMQDLLNKLESELEQLDIDENDGDFDQDLNFDGKPDITYENSNFSYFQLVDRNFDGEPDERHEYDNGTDFHINSQLDENFDGIFETQLVMYQGIIQYEFVDSNNDSMIDIVKNYKDGVLQTINVFTFKSGSEKSKIKTISLKYGVPYETKLIDSNMNHSTFHLKQIKKIPTQKMYKAAK